MNWEPQHWLQKTQVTFLGLFFSEIQAESKNSGLTLDSYINILK